jgi:hypothetical protein
MPDKESLLARLEALDTYLPELDYYAQYSAEEMANDFVKYRAIRFLVQNSVPNTKKLMITDHYSYGSPKSWFTKKKQSPTRSKPDRPGQNWDYTAGLPENRRLRPRSGR